MAQSTNDKTFVPLAKPPQAFTRTVRKLIGQMQEGKIRVPDFQRFDRQQDGGKIHQEVLCQALDLAPSNKYGDGSPRVSFDGALRFVTAARATPGLRSERKPRR